VALENLPGSSNIIRTQGGDPTFLEDYLKSERRKEAKQAKSWFNSSEYTEVWIEIEYLISGVDSPSIEFQDGAAKILQNGRKGFLRRLKALEEFHEDEMIHELRISVKKLRYVQEFFLVRSRDQVTENAFDNLKNVQELLGKFQDVCTEIDRFSQMRTVKTLSDAVRTYPFGYLVGKLDSEKAHLKNQVLSALKEVN